MSEDSNSGKSDKGGDQGGDDKGGSGGAGDKGGGSETVTVAAGDWKSTLSKRDDAVKRAKNAEKDLKDAQGKLEAMEKAQAEADGNKDKLLEMERTKREEAEQAAADATGKLEASDRRDLERRYVDALVAKYPGVQRELIRGLYLSAAEDGTIDRYSTEEDHLEKAAKVIEPLLPKAQSKAGASGGTRVPAGFGSDPNNKKDVDPETVTLQDAATAAKKERGRGSILI